MALSTQEYENKIKELEKEIAELKKRQTVQMKRQQYGLTWIDVPEAFDKESENKIPVLEEVKDKVISNNDGKPTHILIEGDNYHALQCLNYTHKGKVDVIYIDPPYNTGKEFVYKDARFLDKYPDGSLVDSNHPLKHSYWLSFMEKRLKLAKNLLSDEGAIFISIDDYEQANLKLLCDQIFGEKNFQACISRITTKRIKGDVKNINIIHDYLFLYSKTEKYKVKHKLRENFSIYEFEDEFVNERGKYLLRPLDNGNISYSKKADYIITAPDGTKIVAGGEIDLWNQRQTGKYNKKDWCFRWSEDKFKWGLENNFIVFKQVKGKWRCYFKIYQFVDNNLNKTDKYESYTSLFDEMYNNQGTTELKEIVGEQSIFNYPKPLSLLENILNMNNTSSIILDFFAGSGTTLHATMKLNEEDGGTRQCILVQASENNICEEVTYERNKRVIQGYTNSKGEQVPGLGNSLKYYKTAFVGNHDASNATDDDCVTLAKKAGCLLSIGENTLDEIQSTNFFQIYENKNSKLSTAIYFTEELSHFDEFVESVKKVASNHKTVIVYTFSWSSCEDFIYEFEGIPNVEIKAIPQPILEIYKSIYQK